MNNPKGLIILKHEFFQSITNDECIKALPPGYEGLDRQFITVAPESLRLNDLYSAPQPQIALMQRRFFINAIEPKLRELVGYKILYFGLAPIPLAIDLGQQFHNFRDIEIFQLHHVNKTWYQETDHTVIPSFDLQINALPQPKQKGINELVLRLSISHKVKAQDTQEVFPDAAEVDIELTNPNEDAIGSRENMATIGEAFKTAMDVIAGNESNLSVIHLFASIPTGLAFLIGTKISPNIHPLVQTYQYSATEQPKYNKAVLIKGAIDDIVALTDEQRATAKQLRTIADQELQGSIKDFLRANIRDSKGRQWYYGIIPELSPGIMQDRFWRELPAISETSLLSDSIDTTMPDVNNGFYWTDSRWFIDDSFFIALNNRLKTPDEIKKAIRLFLFHEALHYKKHKLGTNNATDIGSFPKVLETADYQADVYGLMNEYGYIINNGIDILDVKKFFLDSIDIATETMWSFDDRGHNLEEIQIRRLNRYLIWYWQYVRIEKEGSSIDSIIQILEEKPVIEVNGMKTKDGGNRFFYDLTRRTSSHLEIAIFKDNEVTRHGSSSPIPIESLIEGVKKMDATLLKHVLRGLRDA